jgi:hypothetical protein
MLFLAMVEVLGRLAWLGRGDAARAVEWFFGTRSRCCVVRSVA